MHKFACAALAILSLTASAKADEWDNTVLLTAGFWSAELATSRTDGAMHCNVKAELWRSDTGASGMLMLTPMPDGTVNIGQYTSDWQVVDGRRYGAAMISIDGKSWRAPAEGLGNDIIMMTLPTGSNFWDWFAYGKVLRIQYPRDSLELSLTGSAAVAKRVAQCMVNVFGDRKFSPFGDDRPTKVDPFGSSM
jgi:hypothetical protein